MEEALPDTASPVLMAEISSNPPEGTITGTYSATSTDIRPGHWIRQPSGYVLVGLMAGPPADNGTLLRGRVSTPGCSTFSVTKSLWPGLRAGNQRPWALFCRSASV